MPNRIDHGLAQVAARALRERAVDPELRRRMRGLPAMLQTSGLAATCAFLLSKAQAGDAYWHTAKILLDEAMTATGRERQDDPNAMLDSLSQITGQKYLIAETRAAMLARWLSRLAQARAEAQDRGGP